MLSYGPSAVITTIPAGSQFKAETIETDSFFITPRVGTTSPWSSKATDIAHVCGLSAITRIARATEWTETGQGIDGAVLGAALSASMPEGVLSAYKDNAAVVEGQPTERFFPDADGVYRGHAEVSHILGKVETHNHPTALSPFPGAAPGSGGEIRDEGATGRGAKPKAGLPGFVVSALRLPGQLEPW